MEIVDYDAFIVSLLLTQIAVVVETRPGILLRTLSSLVSQLLRLRLGDDESQLSLAVATLATALGIEVTMVTTNQWPGIELRFPR